MQEIIEIVMANYKTLLLVMCLCLAVVTVHHQAVVEASSDDAIVVIGGHSKTPFVKVSPGKKKKPGKVYVIAGKK